MIVILICLCYVSSLSVLALDNSEITDIYPPFGHLQGAHRRHRFVRECQPAKYDNVTHELFPPHHSPDGSKPAPMELRYFASQVNLPSSQSLILGHHVIVNDPAQTISILEPQNDGGCSSKTRATVAASADQKQCLFAVNAGFFNVTDGSCLGNVVSDGREAFNSGGIQNAHFGIHQNGSLYFGYVPDYEALNETFQQLVGGAIWLVRNGENFIETSKVAECPDVQTTGELQRFIDVLSSRTAVGHDRLGRVHIVQVDGKTFSRGLNLNDFAEFLISLGLVNAINLDGGGSSTSVLNGFVINYPSDTKKLDNITYSNARNVSTILCVSDYKCVPECGPHGRCVHGTCQCDANWNGNYCQHLLCPGTNCSRHGDCTPAGCKCWSGFDGEDCSASCPEGRYGFGCQGTCKCPDNRTTCDPVTGQCVCEAGYTGLSCEKMCPLGRYGENCEGVCHCDDGCFCDPVSGHCNPQSVSAFWKAGQCYGDLTVVHRGMNSVSPKELRLWVSIVIALCVVAFVSVVLNLCLVCRFCGSKSRLRSRTPKKRRLPHLTIFTDDDDEEVEEFNGRSDGMIPLMNLSANDAPRTT